MNSNPEPASDETVHLPALLVEHGLAASTSAARRDINAGAVHDAQGKLLDFDPLRSRIAGQDVHNGKHRHAVLLPSDSINEQRCEHGKTGKHRVDLIPRLGMWTLCPGPSVVTPPRRRVNGHALCTEPSGVPSRACEMYEGHAGPHRLMPAVVTPPAQDDPLCYWTGHDCLCGASAVMSYEQRRETCHGRRVPVPAVPSVSTDHTDEKCRHDSSTGDEGPDIRHVVRWRCDGCGAIHYDDDSLAAVRAELVGLRAEVDQLRSENVQLHEACRLLGAVNVAESQDAYAGWSAKLAAAGAERDALQAQVAAAHKINADLGEQSARDSAVLLRQGQQIRALQARIDAAKALHQRGRLADRIPDHCTGDHRDRTEWPCALVAALGVDPQKDRQAT